MTAQEARELMPSKVSEQEKTQKELKEIYHFIERASMHDKYSITYAIDEDLVHVIVRELSAEGFNCNVQIYADHSASLIEIDWRNT